MPLRGSTKGDATEVKTDKKGMVRCVSLTHPQVEAKGSALPVDEADKSEKETMLAF